MERLTISYYVLFIAFGIIYFSINWVMKARPAASIIEMYSKSTLIQIMIPFSDSWKAKVRKEHIAPFMVYKSRMNIFSIIFLIILVIIFPVLALWVSRII